MYSNFCDENHAYYLAHYGVPGMKWRVHRGRNRAFDTRNFGRPFAGRRRRRHGGETSNPEYSISSETWRLADLRTSRRRADHRANQANRDYELYVKDRDRNRRKSAAPSKNEMKAKPQSGQRRHRPPEDPIEARNLLDTTKQLARATGASQGNEREYRRLLEAQYGRSGKGGNKRKRGARR